ncbi:MAG TPA: sensor histidine kinase [Myxococcota bacterium]|nr:sensor histidine kinase [Myxococcota bacterium]
MPRPALHQVLATRGSEVIDLWKERVQGKLAPDAMPAIELVDHIPEFVDEILAALRIDAGLPAGGPSPDETSTAAGHGVQRLRLGFSLDSVVREYGALHDAIIATARGAGAELTFRELTVLFEAIVSGIARAVTRYTAQRDAELLRLGNEHFAFIAHELRDPLSSATMAFRLLEAKGALPADSRSVAALERGLRRTSELVDETLQVARAASGIELRRQATTLRDLFEDLQVGATSEAEAREVELRMVVANDQSLSLDIRLLRSALGNLLRNAVKYTAAGSIVEMRGNVVDGRAIFEIEDCCGGLPPGKVEAAFAPFVRLGKSEDGFGLGLAIAKQAADAHGGSIRVQNLPAKGCVFVLDLPISG